MFELRYIPGSPLGAKFPLWRFGQRTTRESAEATRMQCATPDQIEVVEVANSGALPHEIGGFEGSVWDNKDGPDRGVSAPQPGPDRPSFATNERG